MTLPLTFHERTGRSCGRIDAKDFFRCIKNFAPPWRLFHLQTINTIWGGQTTTTAYWLRLGKKYFYPFYTEDVKSEITVLNEGPCLTLSNEKYMWYLEIKFSLILGVWKKKKISLMWLCHARSLSIQHIKWSCLHVALTSENFWRYLMKHFHMFLVFWIKFLCRIKIFSSNSNN